VMFINGSLFSFLLYLPLLSNSWIVCDGTSKIKWVVQTFRQNIILWFSNWMENHPVWKDIQLENTNEVLARLVREKCP
jgi:hypothetical protein